MTGLVFSLVALFAWGCTSSPSWVRSPEKSVLYRVPDQVVIYVVQSENVRL